MPTAPIAEGDGNNGAASGSGSSSINNGVGIPTGSGPINNNNNNNMNNHISVNGATILNRMYNGNSAANAAGQLLSGINNGGQSLMGSDRLQQLVTVTRRRAPTDKPVTSVGQCCNIMESEDVLVQVNCVNGPRNLTFKSATKCSCYHCKKD